MILKGVFFIIIIYPHKELHTRPYKYENIEEELINTYGNITCMSVKLINL